MNALKYILGLHIHKISLLLGIYLSTQLHFGNTDNGLGMIIGASGSYIEIGIYKDGKATSWKIEAYNDEGYYSESIHTKGYTGKIEIKPTEDGMYSYTFNFDNTFERKTITPTERVQFIYKGRRRFKPLIDEAFPNISYKCKRIVEKKANTKIKIAFSKNRDVFFEEKNNSGKKRYKTSLFELQ